MGNWRTVHLRGSVELADWHQLKDHLAVGFEDARWGCLHSGGLFGLQNWATTNSVSRGSRIEFESYGNLGERNYSPKDVAQEVDRIRGTAAPSLIVRIDCGDNYESTKCVATVILGEDGTVKIVPPMVDELPTHLEPSEEEITARMIEAIWEIGS